MAKKEPPRRPARPRAKPAPAPAEKPTTPKKTAATKAAVADPSSRKPVVSPAARSIAGSSRTGADAPKSGRARVRAADPEAPVTDRDVSSAPPPPSEPAPPAPRPRRPALPKRTPASPPSSRAIDSDVEPAPITRRSSPLPAAMAVDVQIPPLPAVRIAVPTEHFDASGDDLVPGYDLDGETAADVAPVGPTEARAPDSARTSSGSSVLPEGDGASEGRPARAASSVELEQQIRDLEARLDQMMRQSRERSEGAPPAPAPAPAAPTAPAMDGFADGDETASTTRELFSTDYYLRHWGRAGMRSRTEEVDEFGLDPAYEARIRPLLDFLYARYFRVDTEGAHRIPDTGPCLIVANHSGGPLPYDGMVLRTAVRREHPKQRELRWLSEDFIYYLPFVGAAMNRLGAVRACQENAERLLSGGRAVAVFPEGAKGIGKLYRDRYRLQRFGRGGFIRLCLRTRTPIVPCGIVGAEEGNPMLYRIEYMAKALGIPYMPVTPTFPALGPLGLLPAPTKWKIRFGDPIAFEGYGPEAADDEILVGRLSERVRTTIQGMLDRTVAERRSIWFG